MIVNIKNALTNNINPMSAYFKVPCAFLMASALPNEVKYLNEPTINIINKTMIIKNEDI